MDVWALTPTIPERSALLAECVASVNAQESPVKAHLAYVDHHGEGPARARNRLLAGVPAQDWVSFVDDDDVWYPEHLTVLREVVQETGCDVAYSMCDVVGRPGWDPQFESFDEARLRSYNYIPLNGVVRAGLLREAGGFPEQDLVYEDWGMWLNLLNAGASFQCTGRRTWAYRFGEWDSRSKEVWDGRRS
jgi:glycosyltransferase involved in cell wall biosynthesis